MKNAFNFLIAPYFYTDARGTTCFFPQGTRAKGFVVPDAASQKRLERFAAFFMLLDLCFPLATLILAFSFFGPSLYARPFLFVGLIAAASILPGALIDRLWYRKRLRELTAELAVVDTTPLSSEIRKAHLKQTSYMALGAFLILCLWIAISTSMMAMTAFHSPELRILCLIGALLFGAFTILCALLIYRKTKLRG